MRLTLLSLHTREQYNQEENPDQYPRLLSPVPQETSMTSFSSVVNSLTNGTTTTEDEATAALCLAQLGQASNLRINLDKPITPYQVRIQMKKVDLAYLQYHFLAHIITT